MNGSLMLEYLAALAANNDRDWFHAHKPQYQAAKTAFEAMVGELTQRLHARDASIPLAAPAEPTFKLMRDTRFSRDKSPYNPAFRAHIAPQGKLPIPVGYYIMVKPGASFLGGGLFADCFKDATAAVRDAIAAQGEEWRRIVEAPVFRQRFTVGGTALKKAPQGYDPAHPQAEYLKNKSWYLEYPIPDDVLAGPDFLSFAAEIFLEMQPFNAFLNRALQGFVMPTR